MIPGAIAGATRKLGAPADMTKEECSALLIRDYNVAGRNTMVSAWYPTPEEVEALVKGAPVYLGITGETHPVVFLTVGSNDL